MERGFKYRIYPNASQRDQIARTLGCCRFVYNRALDVKKTAYSETGKSIATNDLIKMIPAWKRDPETSWLAQVDSMALQQSIRDLDRAYKNFFRRVREGGKPGFPKFKSRRHARQSYRTNGGKILDRNHIALPKLDEAQAKLDSADAQLKQGAIGFFRAMGADDAVNIILNAKYAGKTEVGNSKDATSLDNMLNAIRWMKSVNDYRKSVGLSELHVTYKLIAGAIADANYSDTVLDHARQYDFAENLAWNYGIDPSGQWIEQEKGFFDKATEALYGVTGLVGKDAYDFYAKNGVAINHWIADNCHWENGSSGTVGHYMNIINPELAVMGMATCTKGTMSGLQTQCYTAEISGWSGSGWNMNPISVDEYEQKLTSYINGLKNAKSALDAAKADLASKKQAAAGAATTVQQKQVAVDSAQAGVDAAKQGVADAQTELDAAKADVAAKQQGVTDAQTELDAAKSDLDAANAAVDTAKSTVQQKQVAFDAANAAVPTAASKLFRWMCSRRNAVGEVKLTPQFLDLVSEI